METTEKQAISAREWKGRRGKELNLPSGNTVLVRNPGVEHFLRTGVIPNSLKSAIMEGLEGDSAKDKLQALLKDEKDVVELFELMNRILLQVVIEPKVRPTPLDESGNLVPLEDRDLDFIYVDEVDLEDKAFIFQYAMGGTNDLKSFREEQKDSLESLRSSEDVDVSPKHTVSDPGLV